MSDSKNGFVGLDGFRKGWVAVWIREDARAIEFLKSIDALLRQGFDRAMIDIPIGLPDWGNRDCDLKAKRLLGPNSSRVFTGARRSILTFETQQEANAFCKARGDAGVSAQLFCLGKKIREIDSVATPQLQSRIMETHPELVFLRLNGETPLPGKKTALGRQIRYGLLKRDGFSRLDEWLAESKGTGAKPDDILDACACAIAARDYSHHVSSPLPDAKGLRMEMYY